MTAHRGKGVFAQNGGYELPLINAAVAIGFAFDGLPRQPDDFPFSRRHSGAPAGGA